MSSNHLFLQGAGGLHVQAGFGARWAWLPLPPVREEWRLRLDDGWHVKPIPPAEGQTLQAPGPGSPADPGAALEHAGGF